MCCKLYVTNSPKKVFFTVMLRLLSCDIVLKTLASSLYNKEAIQNILKYMTRETIDQPSNRLQFSKQKIRFWVTFSEYSVISKNWHDNRKFLILLWSLNWFFKSPGLWHKFQRNMMCIYHLSRNFQSNWTNQHKIL